MTSPTSSAQPGMKNSRSTSTGSTVTQSNIHTSPRLTYLADAACMICYRQAGASGLNIGPKHFTPICHQTYTGTCAKSQISSRLSTTTRTGVRPMKTPRRGPQMSAVAHRLQRHCERSSASRLIDSRVLECRARPAQRNPVVYDTHLSRQLYFKVTCQPLQSQSRRGKGQPTPACRISFRNSMRDIWVIRNSTEIEILVTYIGIYYHD